MSKKTPARKRYEERNPTVTFRMAREKKEELDVLLDEMDMTNKDWIEAQVDETVNKYETMRQEAYEEGYEDAATPVPCAECGEPLILDEVGKRELWELLENASTNWSAEPMAGVLAWTQTCGACQKRTTE